METMTRSEWMEGERKAKLILNEIGFRSPYEVRSALAANGCRIVVRQNPIYVDGEYE